MNNVTISPEEYALLEERLQAVSTALAVEDLNWRNITGGGNEVEGMDLEQLKSTSKLAREMAAGSGLIKRGITLRHSYIHSKPLVVPGVDDSTGTRKGRPSREVAFVRKSQNQTALFGASATYPMESALATDGCYLLLGDNKTKTLHAIPLFEIEDIYVDPTFPGEIWAYKRSWVTMEGKDRKTQQRWYYTDRYTGTKRSKIDDTPVDLNHTMIDMWVNRQVGWPLGLPDVLPALLWARIYTELIHYGKIVNDALASFVAKVKVKSKAGAKDAAVKMGGARPGQTAVYGEGNEVDVFSSAGRTYDFDGVRPVAALVATAMEVSLVHLLSDPGAAGSSYGSASNLDLPTKRAMTIRQNEWAAFVERVIAWGSGAKVNISFPPLEEPDLYRSVQSVTMAWQTGLLHEQEARNAMLAALGRVPDEPGPPKGLVIPGTEQENPGDDSTEDEPTGGAGKQAASPDQGRSTGTGRADNALKTGPGSSEN